jgi:hypothetical protein
MKEDYIISGYKEKVFKVLDKITQKLESKENMTNHYFEKKLENHNLNVYLKSTSSTYYGGMAYCKLSLNKDVLIMEINELVVARLHQENNEITKNYFNYVKTETLYVDSLLNELINEVENL